MPCRAPLPSRPLVPGLPILVVPASWLVPSLPCPVIRPRLIASARWSLLLGLCAFILLLSPLRVGRRVCLLVSFAGGLRCSWHGAGASSASIRFALAVAGSAVTSSPLRRCPERHACGRGEPRKHCPRGGDPPGSPKQYCYLRDRDAGVDLRIAPAQTQRLDRAAALSRALSTFRSGDGSSCADCGHGCCVFTTAESGQGAACVGSLTNGDDRCAH